VVAEAPLVIRPESSASAIPDLADAVAAGDGAVRFRGELEAVGVEVLADEHPAHRLSARHVCAASEAVEAVAPEDVKPLYLRRPDAERWRERDGRD
jgi:tRNA threonylcarbamoyladenosine biosynthesis protein TsaB